MKILINGYNYAPELTGIGKYTGEMAEWLAARGHEVTVITAPPHYPTWTVPPAYAGRGWHRERMNGVEVLRSPILLSVGKRRGALQRLALDASWALSSFLWWLPILLRRERYDIVFAVCPTLLAGIMPWVYGLVRGVPWVFHLQDLQVDAAARLGVLKAGLVTHLAFAVENFLLRRATLVTTISENMKRRIEAKGVAETALLPNWADTDFIRPQVPDSDYRRELGAGEEDVLFMYSGSMGEKQGLEIILDAAEHLEGEPRVRFALVGAGSARNALEQEIRVRGLTGIHLRDLVPWDDMPRLLSAGDVHLIVQKRDAADLVLPSKLTNILAAGRPVVATAEPGTALYELITSDNVGLVVAPEDPTAFAAAIRAVSSDAQWRTDTGVRARRTACENLSAPSVLRDFELRLLDLCDRQNA